MRAHERLLVTVTLLSACNGGSCRPEPVPTCPEPNDGTCVDQPHTGEPPIKAANSEAKK